MRPHARPDRHANPWIGLLGLIGYAVPAALLLAIALVLLLAMQPARP